MMMRMRRTRTRTRRTKRRICRLGLQRLGAKLRLRRDRGPETRWRRFGIRSGGPEGKKGRGGGEVSLNEWRRAFLGGGESWGAAGEECGEREGSYHRPVQGEPLWIGSAAVGLSYGEAVRFVGLVARKIF